MEYNQEFKDKITNELIKRVKDKKGSDLVCPICTSDNFILGDGFTRRDLSKNNKNMQIGGLHIPSISIICTNCGHILDFSIGALGFLKKDEKEEQKNDSSKN